MFVPESLKRSKQRFGEFKFEYFGGCDVANKLQITGKKTKKTPQQWNQNQWNQTDYFNYNRDF